MATSYSNSSKPKNQVQTSENFLEALRGLGRSVVTEVKTQAQKAVATDVPQSFGLGGSGTLNPNESFSLSQLDHAEKKGEQKAEAKFNQQLIQMQEQERARLIRSEAAAKEQIKALQEEIRSFAQSVGEFAQEVQIAASQAPVNPGVYHKNFFLHLRSLIQSLRQRVESSRDWLHATNTRGKKQNFYWGQVKKSGTKFMLSSERYMVTSTG